MNLQKYIKPAAVLILFFFAVHTETHAQQTGGGKTGLGIMLGEPSGVSLKVWNNSKTAWDLGVAWSLSGSSSLYAHTDYLWHHWLDVDKGNLAFYIGVGARAVFSDDIHIGARVPLGLNYLIANSPFDLFLEVAPVLDLIPDTGSDANGALGVRFYF